MAPRHTLPVSYIEDLSYSGLSNLIEGSDLIAGNVLNAIAVEKEQIENELKQLRNKVAVLEGRHNSLKSAKDLVLKNIKREAPLAVQRDGYIVVVTKDNISIERNVI
ncbi:hypothetical protein [Peijinzhouia sedimentorum]